MVTSGVGSREPLSELQLVNASALCPVVGQGGAEGWCGTTSFRLVRVADLAPLVPSLSRASLFEANTS